MKLDPHLPQLPSLGELLEHPRVKAVVARINQSTLAHRAADFLDELRATISPRAGQVEIPAVSQLAERLARRLLGESAVGGRVVNATGIVVGDEGLTPPLADSAAHAMLAEASEYLNDGDERRLALEQELCSLTGAEASLVLGRCNAAVRAADDVRHHGPARVDMAPEAGIVNPQTLHMPSVPSLGERLAAGADLVVADGAGLIGGPRCGVIVGRRQYVEEIRRSSLASSAALNPLLATALYATLTAYRQGQHIEFKHVVPVWQLLSAPLANLRQRAERMAALLRAAPAVEAAEACEVEAACLRAGGQELSSPGWVVVVRVRGLGGPSLAAALSEGTPSILLRESGEGVALYLRSIFPRWDQQVVAAFEHGFP